LVGAMIKSIEVNTLSGESEVVPKLNMQVN